MTRSLLERPEATTRSIDELLAAVRRGELRIPKFQRNFQWRADDIRKLFDSIYRAYPIGNLLFWATDRGHGSGSVLPRLESRPVPANTLLVIDGQQRLVSLARVLLDPDGDGGDAGKFRVCFDLHHRKFKHYAAASGPPPDALPLNEVADTVRYLEWLRRLKSGDPTLVEAANEVVSALRDYRIPVYIVRFAEEKEVREIFERMNTGGEPLKPADIFNALHGHATGSPGNLTTLKQRLAGLGFGELDETWLLKITGAVLGLDVTRKLAEALSEYSPQEIENALQRACRAVERVVEFLRDDARIAHFELLPYRFPLVPLAKFFDLVPSPSPVARAHLAAWLWRSAVTEEHRRSDAISIRTTLELVSRDEVATVQGLLSKAATPATDAFVLRRHDFRAARTKVACNALLALDPRDLGDGRKLDVAALLGEHGENAFPHLLKARASFTTANRLAHPQGGRPALIERLRSWAEAAQPDRFDTSSVLAGEVLQSHAVDAEGRRALLSRDDAAFLRARTACIEARVREYLEDRCAVPAVPSGTAAGTQSLEGEQA